MVDTAQDSRFAAEYSADVSVEKLAEIYAEAFIGAADEKGISAADAVEEYESFVELLKIQPKFAEVLFSEMVSPDEKLTLLEKTISSKASPLFWSFLQTLARRNRLVLLRLVFRQVQITLNERQNKIPVVITTAAELDNELLQSLTEKLRAVIGGEPIISSTVNPDLLSGLVVRVGDTVFDASILTQLKNVRQQMIDRSAYEIQCRRNIFCNTEGN
ncbi:MAG: ATP synthase F1 subunit delta [Planctomycetaceae bacterium]|jgi:F-type H+-transporting ATPase subunit delta|nr:ATP synthase F1 subunit delta [Planctomycetaceae bacterium]